MNESPGMKFRKAIKEETPLQIMGAINAYVALMAKNCGYKALYLSGAGVANASYGLPDLGMTTLDNVLTDARRITDVVDLPLLVDIDTGWGDHLMIARTIKQMERAGVAAVHIEDQVSAKRCGHRPGKNLVGKEEMCRRIYAAVAAKSSSDFVLMARTDALAVEGVEKMVERCLAYKQAGADMLFAEAITDPRIYKDLKEAIGLPLLANMTEFGKSPLLSAKDLGEYGVDMVLYPLSIARTMNKAAFDALQEIRATGSQKTLLPAMQTREELYHFLNYFHWEQCQSSNEAKN